MSPSTPPLGRMEDQRLELEGSEALRDPAKLAREVVALLNREGGELWIGIAEESGRAARVEPIGDVQREIDRLIDSFHDRIEPAPGGKLDLEAVTVPGFGRVIRVAVRPGGARRPYALLTRGEGRRFVTRVGRRTAPMSREELRDLFIDASREDESTARALNKVRSRLEELQREGADCLWIRLQPVPEIALEVQDEALSRLLMDPSQIDHPLASPSFHVPHEPTLGSGVELGTGELVASAAPFGRPVKATRIRADGGIDFQSELELLYQHSGGSTPQQIDPEALLGIPVSLLRLAATAWSRYLQPADPVLVDLALLGAGRQGAVLRPGRFDPESVQPGRAWADPNRLESEDLVLPRPLELPFARLRDEPDRTVYRLVRAVYEAFGLREEAIPMSFDKAGRLLISA